MNVSKNVRLPNEATGGESDHVSSKIHLQFIRYITYDILLSVERRVYYVPLSYFKHRNVSFILCNWK